MKSYLLGSLLILGILALATAPTFASTIDVTAVPPHIPTNTDTQLKFHNSAAAADRVDALWVIDPDGTVFTYKHTPFWVPGFGDVYVGYGPSYVGDWNPIPKPISNPQLTSVSGEYHAECTYYDGTKGYSGFNASAPFWVPEFTLGTATITALGFAGLTLLRRYKKKS